MAAPILDSLYFKRQAYERSAEHASAWIAYMNAAAGFAPAKSRSTIRAEAVADAKARYVGGELSIEAFEARLDVAFGLRAA